MTRRTRIGGTLSTTALAALKALRRAEAVAAIPDRPARPCDRVDYLATARELIAQGATVTDVAHALDITVDAVRVLIGPKPDRARRPRIDRGDSD